MPSPSPSFVRSAGASLLLAALCACGGNAGDDGEGQGFQAVAEGGKTLAAAGAGVTAAAPVVDAVRTWNEVALDTTRGLSLSDAQSARLYAMVNVALFDAINGIDSQTGVKREAALVPVTGGPKKGNSSVAGVVAAHAVLTRLYPARASLYDAQLSADLAAVPEGAPKTQGSAWGASVGAEVYRLREQDGSAPNEVQPAGTGAGAFRASWSGVQFRWLAPFVIANPALYAAFAPPALSSAEYAAAFNEVKVLGDAGLPDPQALATYQFWSSGAGTSQPPGEWIKLGLSLSAQQTLSLAESARLLALLGMALSDAVAPTFSMKFNNQAWRPTTAIREADLDGNADTTADFNWSPRAGTIGGSPENVSGHSSFSGAAATVLRGYFCSDSIAFSTASDAAPNAPRQYGSFTEVELEVGQSRVLGGLHFEFSNRAGQQAGRGVGAEVVAKALLRSNGQTHHGTCPK